MKVVCDRAAVLDALGMASSVVSGRTPSPILHCVKLVASDGRLSIAATDSEIAVRIGVAQVDVQDDGDALVPADKLVQIVRASEDATLTLHAQKQALHIKGADSHFKVLGFDPKEYPPIKDFPESKADCIVNAAQFRRLVTRSLFATAVENSRYAINGVLFERSGRKLRLVATDGRRLAVARGECDSAADGDTRCIIPTKALNILNRLIDDPDASVKVSVDSHQVRFLIGDADDAAMLTSNLVEGSFPPFEDVIPKDQDKRVTIDASELTSAVRRAALLTNQESKGVRLAFGDHRLVLSSRAPEMGEAEIQVEMPEYQGEPIEIGFNPSFIVDALKVIDGGPVMIELKAPNKPGVLKVGQDFTYVVMPVSLA
ncbi:MAG: DNA polymerase III subunit beta [Phycisphaerales bacterium]|nr:DNA polymerase III subunit beta [Phycisphaerales bacterium]